MAGVTALRGDREIQRTRTTGGGATVVSGDNPETSLVVASETSLKSHPTTHSSVVLRELFILGASVFSTITINGSSC